MKFTDDQMIEISRARERLWAIKDKIQPYPIIEAVTANVERVREVVIERQPANLEHVRAELNYLHNKILELRAEKKKREESPDPF